MPFKNMSPPFKQLTNRVGRKLLEKDIEDYARDEFKKLGWIMEKFTSPQKRSVPDDIITAPDYPSALIFFIEFKQPKETATPQQMKDHAKRRELGAIVFVVDCYGQLDATIEIAKWILANGLVPELPRWLMK